MTDPIRTWRVRIGLTALFGAGLIAISAAWGLRPIELPIPEQLQHRSERTAPAVQPAEPMLDRSVFDAPLRAPSPASKVASPARTAPVARVESYELELIGIVQDSERRRAAIYDSMEAEIRLLAPGQRVGPYVIRSIEADRVELEHSGGTRTLRLREDEP